MRTFIALELPKPIQWQIGQQQQHLQEALKTANLQRTVRWVAPHRMHVTLRFFGETTEEQAQSLANALERAIDGHSPFDLALAGLGCFPTMRQPRVIWIGLRGAVQPLQTVQSRIEQIAQDAGFAPDRRVFSPHITLGRVPRRANRQDAQRLGDVLQAVAADMPTDPAQDPFHANRIVLFRSDLRPDGSVYTPLAHITLR